MFGGRKSRDGIFCQGGFRLVCVGVLDEMTAFSRGETRASREWGFPLGNFRISKYLCTYSSLAGHNPMLCPPVFSADRAWHALPCLIVISVPLVISFARPVT